MQGHLQDFSGTALLPTAQDRVAVKMMLCRRWLRNGRNHSRPTEERTSPEGHAGRLTGFDFGKMKGLWATFIPSLNVVYLGLPLHRKTVLSNSIRGGPREKTETISQELKAGFWHIRWAGPQEVHSWGLKSLCGWELAGDQGWVARCVRAMLELPCGSTATETSKSIRGPGFSPWKPDQHYFGARNQGLLEDSQLPTSARRRRLPPALDVGLHLSQKLRLCMTHSEQSWLPRLP